MQQLREGTSTIAYVVGAITIVPFWFAFWMWFFIGLLLESIRWDAPVTTVQRLYGLSVLALEVVVGKVRGPSSFALTAASDGEVEVMSMSKDWITLKLVKTKPTWYPKLHFIIFPGAFYSPLSYAPLARELCKRGSLVSIWNVTFTSAYVSDMTPVVKKIEESTDTQWVLIGHSLGGVQIGKLARSLKDSNHLEKVAGLVFLASFPATADLADIEVPTLTVHGSNDTVSRKSKHPNATRHFPKKSEVRTIIGANHSQFSSVTDPLPLDGAAAITEEQQVQQTAALVLDFLARHVSPPNESAQSGDMGTN